MIYRIMRSNEIISICYINSLNTYYVFNKKFNDFYHFNLPYQYFIKYLSRYFSMYINSQGYGNCFFTQVGSNCILYCIIWFIHLSIYWKTFSKSKKTQKTTTSFQMAIVNFIWWTHLNLYSHSLPCELLICVHFFS